MAIDQRFSSPNIGGVLTTAYTDGRPLQGTDWEYLKNYIRNNQSIGEMENAGAPELIDPYAYQYFDIPEYGRVAYDPQRNSFVKVTEELSRGPEVPGLKGYYDELEMGGDGNASVTNREAFDRNSMSFVDPLIKITRAIMLAMAGGAGLEAAGATTGTTVGSAAGATGAGGGAAAGGAVGTGTGYAIPTAAELSAAGFGTGGIGLTGAGGIGAASSVAGAGAGAAGYGGLSALGAGAGLDAAAGDLILDYGGMGLTGPGGIGVAPSVVEAGAGAAGYGGGALAAGATSGAGSSGTSASGPGEVTNPSSFSDARYAAESGIDPSYAGTGTATNTLADYLNMAKNAMGGAQSFMQNPWVQVGSSLLNGYMGSKAADKAADAQLGGINAGIGEQRRQFDLTRSDLAPYRERGYQANNRLAMMMGLQPNAATYKGDMAAYQQDPIFNSGFQSAPKYQPGETANALSRYMKPLGAR
jgi:hypothetical protein